MSYRAFKRLLGETSLERKCRFLFGGFILLLITGSFWLYARQTEHLAYDQLKTTCRLLVVQIVDRQLATGCRPVGRGAVAAAGPEAAAARPLDEFRSEWEEELDRAEALAEAMQDYEFRIIKADPRAGPSQRARPESARQRLKEFQDDRDLHEDSHLLLARARTSYYGAVRASPSCLGCHQQAQARPARGRPARRRQDRGADRGRSPTSSTSTAPCSSPPPW